MATALVASARKASSTQATASRSSGTIAAQIRFGQDGHPAHAARSSQGCCAVDRSAGAGPCRRCGRTGSGRSGPPARPCRRAAPRCRRRRRLRRSRALPHRHAACRRRSRPRDSSTTSSSRSRHMAKVSAVVEPDAAAERIRKARQFLDLHRTPGVEARLHRGAALHRQADDPRPRRSAP